MPLNPAKVKALKSRAGKSSSVVISPSLLSADPLAFGAEAAEMERLGADWHHIDVMDGHFVPNLTFGLPLIRALKKTSKIPLDVHIMVSNPDETALDYVAAGADLLTFHIEAARHPHRLAQSIRASGSKAGISMNPGSPVDLVFPLLETIDLVLIMSVNPGFGGQSFISESVARVRRLREEIEARGLEKQVVINVDGGINAETGALVVKAGAGAVVAGNYLYGAPDRKKAMMKLRTSL